MGKQKKARDPNRHQKWEQRRNSTNYVDADTLNPVIQSPIKSALSHIFNTDGLNLSTFASKAGVKASDLRKARQNPRKLSEKQQSGIIREAYTLGWQPPTT